MYKAIRYGIFEAPSRRFPPGCAMELGDLPQSTEDIQFAKTEIQLGLDTGIFARVSQEYARKAMADEAIISTAFTFWFGSGEEINGRFVLNLSRVSKHWPKGSVRSQAGQILL